MTFAASSLAICLAVSLLCAAGCNASPLMAGDSSNQAHVAFELLSNAMKQSANALALVQEATIYTMAKHETSFNFFHSAATRPDRRLQQQEQSCPASQTASCTSQIERPNLRSCMFALFKAAAGNPLNSPFAFPSLLCQLASTNSSCASDLIGYFKTCTCVDFQPLYNLACPSAPTASTCSRNSFVKRFLALNAQNSSLGFFGETMMQFPFPQTGVRPDLAPCGNADAYRQTVLINGLGPCLYSIIDAFPLPTFVLSQTVTNTSLNMGQMIRDGMRCALTAPSYRYQTYCSGNIAKCFSLRQTPDFDLCRGATASSCPAGCRDKLAAYGASSSSSPAKCCVKWFQQQAKAEQCSDAAAVSVASFMGPECMGFVRTQLSNAPPQPGQPRMSPEMLNALFNTPILPGQCAARSPAALAVDNCAVPEAGLAPSCPDDSTPYVRASLFAPKQTSTATITFSSSSLKAVSAPLYSFFSNRSPVPLSSSGRPLLTFPAQVLATKYSQTLEAVQKALESRVCARAGNHA
jgi:hypothetical protein